MCLATPARIIELLDDDKARVSLDGVAVKVSLALIDEPKIGDYVIIHVGYALSKLDEEEADQMLESLRQATLA